MNDEQVDKIATGSGFIAALDQSGGSTPKALALYGIGEDEYGNDDEMFDAVHEMRTRIITSPSFHGDRVLGAILFEDTMDRQIDGRDTPEYLWEVKGVVPFLKVDKGLADEIDSAQLMKPMPGLDELLDRAVAKRVFGTKMRSVISSADPKGIDAVVTQQFDVGNQILAKGLVPIIEPEVDIHAADKPEAEALLRDAIVARLDDIGNGQRVMLKLSIPSEDGFYSDLIADPRVLRIVALSGGYPRDEANERLARNPGMIASFSRALTEGLTAQQSDDEFDAELGEAIDSIAAASKT